MRTKLIAGNWKMNKGFNDAMTLIAELGERERNQPWSDTKEVLIVPPALYTRHAFEFLRNAKSKIQLGCQDTAACNDGAYTGELSASMIKEAGATHVLLGHSERRQYYNEDGAVLKEKVDLALEAGLKVIYCCGELLSERQKGEHFSTVTSQLKEVLFTLDKSQMEHVVIAYEPVWAIGTGETASPDQAQEMHAFIRSEVAGHFDEVTGSKVRILYGGSMKPSNASTLLSQPDVDGGLIGGASLSAEDFGGIIHS